MTPRRGRAGALSGLAFLLAASAAPGGAEPVDCAAAPVRVDAGGLLPLRVCTTAARMEALLAPCGLRQTRPVTVFVVDDPAQVARHCVAMFDCGSDEMTVLPPQLMADTMVDPAFARLPGPDLFDAVIVHELTHAFIAQTAGDTVTTLAHEYLAYSFEIAAMAPQTRAAFLATHEGEAAGTLDLIDAATMTGRPGLFAANAYLHFSAPGNGCDFARRLLAADPTLPDVFLPP